MKITINDYYKLRKMFILIPFTGGEIDYFNIVYNKYFKIPLTLSCDITIYVGIGMIQIVKLEDDWYVVISSGEYNKFSDFEEVKDFLKNIKWLSGEFDQTNYKICKKLMNYMIDTNQYYKSIGYYRAPFNSKEHNFLEKYGEFIEQGKFSYYRMLFEKYSFSIIDIDGYYVIRYKMVDVSYTTLFKIDKNEFYIFMGLIKELFVNKL